MSIFLRFQPTCWPHLLETPHVLASRNRRPFLQAVCKKHCVFWRSVMVQAAYYGDGVQTMNVHI